MAPEYKYFFTYLHVEHPWSQEEGEISVIAKSYNEAVSAAQNALPFLEKGEKWTLSLLKIEAIERMVAL